MPLVIHLWVIDASSNQRRMGVSWLTCRTKRGVEVGGYLGTDKFEADPMRSYGGGQSYGGPREGRRFLMSEVPLQGAGRRVQGTGCRVQGAGCRVQGARFRVQGSGCMVQGSGYLGNDDFEADALVDKAEDRLLHLQRVRRALLHGQRFSSQFKKCAWQKCRAVPWRARI